MKTVTSEGRDWGVALNPDGAYTIDIDVVGSDVLVELTQQDLENMLEKLKKAGEEF